MQSPHRVAGPAYRVLTKRLLLRCWSPMDAPLLRASLDRSDAHLRTFIPFMRHEPRTFPETVQRLRSHRSQFDLDTQYRFGVFSLSEEHLLGEVMLLDRAQTGEREVGYWIDVDHCGHGYATEATGALVRLAFDLEGCAFVELGCDPANQGSTAVARKLGFTLEATLKQRCSRAGGGASDLMLWSLFREDWVNQPRIALEAYDASGQRLL